MSIIRVNGLYNLFKKGGRGRIRFWLLNAQDETKKKHGIPVQ